MINKIKNLICKILEKFFFKFFKNSYYLVKHFKSHFYNVDEDLKYNEDLLISLGFDIDGIKSELKLLNFDYKDAKLSWHYHLLIGLKKYFKYQNIQILEIGTYDGKFTNFASRVFGKSNIITIDLDDNDEKFVNSYQRNDKKLMLNHLEKRKKNIDRQNIDFIKLNSIYIKKFFSEKKFDLIWVDGDHLNPQVTIDIINSLDLLSSNGVLCVDDIVKDTNFKKNNYVSNESYFTLNQLESSKIVKNYFFIKRIRKENSYKKKYCSLSVFYQNKNLKK